LSCIQLRRKEDCRHALAFWCPPEYKFFDFLGMRCPRYKGNCTLIASYVNADGSNFQPELVTAAARKIASKNPGCCIAGVSGHILLDTGYVAFVEWKTTDCTCGRFFDVAGLPERDERRKTMVFDGGSKEVGWRHHFTVSEHCISIISASNLRNNFQTNIAMLVAAIASTDFQGILSRNGKNIKTHSAGFFFESTLVVITTEGSTFPLNQIVADYLKRIDGNADKVEQILLHLWLDEQQYDWLISNGILNVEKNSKELSFDVDSDPTVSHLVNQFEQMFQSVPFFRQSSTHDTPESSPENLKK